tara:strand:+ start:970 stop:1362 length:393 start_codon:yes stop_codon:yes gene_type:complete
MAAQLPQLHTLIYKEINVGKFKTTRHYELINFIDPKIKLTKLLNLSKNREFAKSSPIFWLQIRIDNKWQKPRLTGLFKTSLSNVYYGDIDKCKHLLLFNFSDRTNTLTIKYFENYYTANLTSLLPLFIEQ